MVHTLQQLLMVKTLQFLAKLKNINVTNGQASANAAGMADAKM